MERLNCCSQQSSRLPSYAWLCWWPGQVREIFQATWTWQEAVYHIHWYRALVWSPCLAFKLSEWEDPCRRQVCSWKPSWCSCTSASVWIHDSPLLNRMMPDLKNCIALACREHLHFQNAWRGENVHVNCVLINQPVDTHTGICKHTENSSSSTHESVQFCDCIRWPMTANDDPLQAALESLGWRDPKKMTKSNTDERIYFWFRTQI